MKEKIFGTTLYIGSVPMETRLGTFTCHTFQNLIHKGYILALAFGDLQAKELYTRVHSSCVTSETLRSMDCDCVHQLEGAMETIAKKGHGILFYLIQEGRGCGYVGKSRACMMVQYHDDKITTFDAYKELGMKSDYRDYRNIWEVTRMLGIEDASFVLLTNNPDKIKGTQESGMKIARVESIEVAPSPFNQSYLKSKQEMGHILFNAKKKVSRYKIPFEKVKPFTPSPLPLCSRYIHCASYYLPIKPVDNQMEFKEEELGKLRAKGVSCTITAKLPSDNYLVKLDDKDLEKVDVHPYWFKVNMYYDVVSSSDYIVLTYGDLETRTPLVRVHSESLFNRFPVSMKPYREKYKKSLEAIVKNQSGVIILPYRDGRGAGLGSFVLNQTQDALTTGTPIDSRDYGAIVMLLEAHLPQKELSILYSQSSRVHLREALEKQGLHVKEWIDLEKKDEDKGHDMIARRIHDAPHYLLNLQSYSFYLDPDTESIVTGVGSSEAHALYLLYLLRKFRPNVRAKFLPMTAFSHEKKKGETLILISQGLSPNVLVALDAWQYRDVKLLTSVTSKNQDAGKVAVLETLRNNRSDVYNFPLEDEYTTLIRTVGPLVGYYFIYKLLHPASYMSLSEEKRLHQTLMAAGAKVPSRDFFTSLQKDPHIVILVSYPLNLYFKNILNKLEEGAFLPSVRLVDYLEFSHGAFQNVEYQFQKGRVSHFVLIKQSKVDQEAIPRVKLMLGDRFPIWELSSELPEDLSILEYEMVFNHFVLKWMELMAIDQKSWAGKERQALLYEWQPGAPH
ncbi:MAG: hypothetical protein HYW48_03465 [Deltaproteobacteria bacterium]|nr:hypothetical protein [Deltaproteobacteria bacterium]